MLEVRVKELEKKLDKEIKHNEALAKKGLSVPWD
jgi:hypothetical protein